MPVALIARYHVKPGHSQTVADALRQMAEKVRSDEPGCLLYHANIDPDNENLYCLYEVYTDEAGVTAHRETTHFQHFIEGIVVPVLDKRERELYRQVIG